MIFSSNSGDIECLIEEEIETLIRESSFKPFDDIWIGSEERYPCLAILINKELACVHYFLNDYGDAYQSIGNYKETNTVEFIAGGEKTELPYYSVVTLDKAIECAKQFFLVQNLPSCIEWNEL